MPSLGPDCAALTSIGTVYLYRLAPTDALAYTESPAPRLPGERFRSLLGRIASTSVSDKGAAVAGPLTRQHVASLTDDEIERLAEAYLESPALRRLQQEAAAATPPLTRERGEPATKFLDRVVRREASPRHAAIVEDVPAAAISAALDAPQTVPAPPRTERSRFGWSWITGSVLFVASCLALVALLQSQFTMQTLRRDRQDLVAQLRQIRETNASLGTQLARLETENSDLRQRIAAMDANLRAQVVTQAAKVREAKPKAAAAKSASSKTRSPGLRRSHSTARWPRY